MSKHIVDTDRHVIITTHPRWPKEKFVDPVEPSDGEVVSHVNHVDKVEILVNTYEGHQLIVLGKAELRAIVKAIDRLETEGFDMPYQTEF